MFGLGLVVGGAGVVRGLITVRLLQASGKKMKVL